MAASISLKWGNLKSWSGMDDGHPARIALQKYMDAGPSASAMAEQSQEERRLICEIIDAVDGKIVNDWTGNVMTKNEAKEYVMSHMTEDTATDS